MSGTTFVLPIEAVSGVEPIAFAGIGLFVPGEPTGVSDEAAALIDEADTPLERTTKHAKRKAHEPLTSSEAASETEENEPEEPGE